MGATTLGVGSALMIVSGYYGELTVTGDLSARWKCWFLSMAFFLYIVFELLVGLNGATQSESDPQIKKKIQLAQQVNGDQLVHIPDCVPLPHVRHHCRERRRRHPDRLLCIGHHLQVRRWPLDLPDHLCQVVQGS